MNITPTATAGTVATTQTAATGKPVISSDFQTFLKMLTTQMQNQDPLNPMEATDFAVQLATFSGVEQQVQTNQLLQGLSAQMGLMGMTQFAGWVGMEARAAVPALYSGDPITLAPNPAMRADRAELIVRNAFGTEVDRRPVPISTDQISWSGLSADGTPLPSGTYSFELTSYEGNDVLRSDTVEHYARVTEARGEAGEVFLILHGGAKVSASQVTALRRPEAD
jgi:flagellar basal-body rod modification protein FlgD